MDPLEGGERKAVQPGTSGLRKHIHGSEFTEFARK